MNATCLRALLWLSTLALCGLGLVMVASTTTARGGPDGEATYAYVLRQALALGIGIAGALVLARLGTRWLRDRRIVIAAVAATVVLLLVARWFMPPVNGAWRWIDLGPIKVQPSELAKLVLIVATAWYLTRVEERVRVDWHGVLLPMAGFGLLAVLVYQTRDLGSVVVMAVLLWVLLMYAGANWIYSAVLGLCCAPMILYEAVFKTAYRRERLLAFLDPLDPGNAAAYHLKQSYIAISSGGWWGVGLGQGMSKNSYLPENHTDFIFAAICEELGFAGGLAVALAFLLLVVCGLLIAARARDRHQRLLAVGATILVGFQAFWNMLVVTGALPTKGLTLPFVSYGGSSLVVCLLAIGLLDAVLRACPQERAAADPRTARIGAEVVDDRGALAW